MTHPEIQLYFRAYTSILFSPIFPSFLSGQLSLIDGGQPAKRRMMILASADPAFVFEYLALVGN